LGKDKKELCIFSMIDKRNRVFKKKMISDLSCAMFLELQPAKYFLSLIANVLQKKYKKLLTT
jgi:hypothetical protein